MIGISNCKERENLIFIAVLSMIFSQVHIGVFIDNFNISFGIVVLVLFFYINNMATKLKVGAMCGALVWLSRAFVQFIKFNGDINYFSRALINFFPEVLFYIGYVAIYSILSKRIDNENKLFIYTILCDASANMGEIIFRYFVLRQEIGPTVFIGLIIVAITRACLIWIIVNLMSRYNLKLLKKEHKERYTGLLLATSRMKSEIYLMEKTMENIESLMSKSYGLYNSIKEKEKYEPWEQSALCITKDIHEVKKQLFLIKRGVEEITDERINHSSMEFYDLLDLINEMMTPSLKDKNLRLCINRGEGFKTQHHYYLISIFRNLINNGIDAMEGEEGAIYLMHRLINREDNFFHYFSIRDFGTGISEEDIDVIFKPGFSTKINFDTGSINRGLGLSVVKDIIEDKLNGNIQVKSEKGKGTEFIILIPKEKLEE